jgi:acetyl-CoA acetyltransferase
VPERNTLQLQTDAVRAALSDAGLQFSDVDGLITVPVRTETWSMPCGVVAEYLGIRPRYLMTVDLAGASGVATVNQAAMAIAAGQCETAICVAGQNLLSYSSTKEAIKSLAQSGGPHPQFEAPYGPLVPSLYAMVAQRHMSEYGTTAEQLASVAVAIRQHAVRNPWAHKRTPLTVDEVLRSPLVSSPLHQLDCSLISDGAAAIVVTSLERSRDLKQLPVRILGSGYGFTHQYAGSNRDICTTGAVSSGRDAFGNAGLTPNDVDVAELYDCFTITVIVELEDLGFCKKGEGGSFVESVGLDLDSDLPITTHGGLLSAAHPGLPGGFFHVVEGVQQIRGDAFGRQVENAEVALVHGNGGILGVHASMLLGRG